MPAAAKVFPAQFVRRTALEPDERRINFHQIDHNVIMAITSEEAARTTDKMAKIYLRLVAAPTKFQPTPGALCFPGEHRGNEWITGHDQLIEWLGVSSATAAKALAWLSEKAIIGYSSPKNSHPTRIWLNHAADSIAKKPEAPRTNLRLVDPVEAPAKTANNAAKNFVPAGSNLSAPGSNFEPAFKEVDLIESYLAGTPPAAETPREVLAGGEKAAAQSVAANSGAALATAPVPGPAPTAAQAATNPAPETAPAASPAPDPVCQQAGPQSGEPVPETALLAAQIAELAVEIARLRSEVAQKPSAGGLLGAVSAAVRAEINDQLNFQFNLTRDWLTNKALPQVARISQSETYKVLRSSGLLKSKEAERASIYVGASTSTGSGASNAKTSVKAEVKTSVKTGTGASPPPAAPGLLTEGELLNAAEAVLVMAGIRQISVEESLQRILVESWAADERTKAPQYEQALRELVADDTLRQQLRRKVACQENKRN